MTADGHSVALLSGEITVEQRLAVLNRFREGKEKLLITTNVSLTGTDSEQVTKCQPALAAIYISQDHWTSFPFALCVPSTQLP